MKHTFDEPTMQAAIDAACKATASSTYRPSFALLRLIESDTTDDWPKEKPARLHLLKTALDLLPEPLPPVVDGKTPGEYLYNSMFEDCDEKVSWAKLLAGDKALYKRAASAVLAAFGGQREREEQNNYLEFYGKVCRALQKLGNGSVRYPTKEEVIARLEALSQPTEIPWIPWNGGECPVEKGTLIEVRYRDGEERNNLRALALEIGRDASVSYWENDGMAEDIIAYRIKPTPSTFTAHGKEWTPAVGDVVMLKSGGPKMTVANNDGTKVTCLWFNPSLERTFGDFIVKTLTKADS